MKDKKRLIEAVKALDLLYCNDPTAFDAVEQSIVNLVAQYISKTPATNLALKGASAQNLN